MGQTTPPDDVVSEYKRGPDSSIPPEPAPIAEICVEESGEESGIIPPGRVALIIGEIAVIIGEIAVISVILSGARKRVQ